MLAMEYGRQFLLFGMSYSLEMPPFAIFTEPEMISRQREEGLGAESAEGSLRIGDAVVLLCGKARRRAQTLFSLYERAGNLPRFPNPPLTGLTRLLTGRGEQIPY